MSIVVGFIDTPEGNAAVQSAIDEAKLRSSSIVILHSMQGGNHEKGSEYLASAEAIERVAERTSDRILFATGERRPSHDDQHRRSFAATAHFQ